jgi:hypothetical protein
MKYIPGDKFTIVPLLAALDTLAFAFSGILSQKLGTPNTIALSFGVACLGSYAIIISPDSLSIYFLIITKFGVNVAYTQAFIYTT